MPSFFQRRYMRGQPGGTEKVLGVVLLIIGVIIVLTFGLTTGLFGGRTSGSALSRAAKLMLGISDEPLFTVDPANFRPAAPARTVRIARAMLPTTLPGLERTELEVVDPRAGQPAPGGDALIEAAVAFGAGEIYRADYASATNEGTSDELKASLRVCVVDADEVENAFGLWRSREPADAKQLNIGRAGWQETDGQRLGFWAGRYYTELEAMGTVGPADLENAARVIAGPQLVYGGPFWAETVLPAEDRVEGSLRYVRREPFGLAALSDCWLAEYADGVTLGVMELPAERREAVLAGLRDALAGQTVTDDEVSASTTEAAEETGEEAAYEGESATSEGPAKGLVVLPTGAVSGTHDGKPFAACPAGGYLFVASGVEPTRVTAVVQAAVARTSAAAMAATEPAAASTAAVAAGTARFAETGEADILAPTQIERYTDNLYEKIDGREPQFRQFGFVELRVGQYQHDPTKQVFDAYVFDMGEPVNAMGIYLTERSGSAHDVEIGRGGYVSGSNVYFWKSRYYVYILGPAEEDAQATKLAERIAQAIEATIADQGESFWAEKLLPAEDRVADSLSYRAGSGLGFDFLKRMFLANYQAGDKTYQTYIIRADDAAGARALFEQFVEATAKYDKVLSRSASPGGETMVSESLGTFGAAFCKERYFGGMTDCPDRAMAERKITAFRDSLPNE